LPFRKEFRKNALNKTIRSSRDGFNPINNPLLGAILGPNTVDRCGSTPLTGRTVPVNSEQKFDLNKILFPRKKYSKFEIYINKRQKKINKTGVVVFELIGARKFKK
jgi:hypothetical protein